MASPTPDRQPNPAAPASNRRVPWASLIGFVGLAANFALYVYRADGDRGAIAFVSFSYLNLLLLFRCIRHFKLVFTWKEAARGRIKLVFTWKEAARGRIKLVFTWKEAARGRIKLVFTWNEAARGRIKLVFTLKVAAAAAAWIMAAATVVGGFYAFFVHDDK